MRKLIPLTKEWHRAGGLSGGPARAQMLTPERRKEIAKMGFSARKTWPKKYKKKTAEIA